MNNRKLKIILYTLGIVFVLLLIIFSLTIFLEFTKDLFNIVAVLALSLLVLGITLLVLSKGTKGKLKTYLFLTGFSAIAPFVFSILHNVFYALAIIFSSFSMLFEFLSGVSFIISLLIAPIAFIIGLIGSIIIINKKNV